MAVKKATGGAKKVAVKKAAAKKVAAKKEAPAAKKSAPKAKATVTAAPSPAPATATAPKKKGAAKKASAALTKLSTSQSELLKKIGAVPEPGYKSERKAELRTIEALQERKLIKRGSKDKATGAYHYLISNAGKKHLGAEANSSTNPAGTP